MDRFNEFDQILKYMVMFKKQKIKPIYVRSIGVFFKMVG